MYFPQNMTFQYFFFDTYVGYFLQALPLALITSVTYYLIKFRNDSKTPLSKKIFSSIFICYITGLICLTIGLDIINIIWYKLIYHMDPGTSINWFNGNFSFNLNFISNLTKENIGNFLMFLPFGILYPLSQKEFNYKNTIIKGIILVLIIEVLEPLFGRAFDINDIILNTLGIIISTLIYKIINKKIRRKNNERNN